MNILSPSRGIQSLNLYSILFYFFIYSFIGWIVEGLYSLALTGNFSKEGFLIGPLKPMYGFAMTIILILYTYYNYNNIVLLIFLSMIVPTSVEYLSGFLLDKIFHLKYWDYSSLPLNINGYVCILFSVFWIALCLFAVYIIHPLIKTLYYNYEMLINAFSLALLIYILVDLLITITLKLPIKKIL